MAQFVAIKERRELIVGRAADYESADTHHANVAQFVTIKERSELIVGRAADYKSADTHHADVAQLAEQLICNQQVIGSSPIIGFFE